MRKDYKKPLIKIILGSCLSFFLTPLFANGFQLFNGINYGNPAFLQYIVKDLQIMLGEDIAYPHITFSGTVTTPDPLQVGSNIVTSGTTSNYGTSELPYGRFAKRINPNLVVGLEVTEPFAYNYSFPDTSAVRYSVTTFKIDSTNISPVFSWQLPGSLSKITIGGGFDALYSTLNIASMYPSLPTISPSKGFIPFGAGADVAATNNVSSWFYGWHVGAAYHLAEGTFVGGSYYSPLNTTAKGTSTFTGFPDSNTLAVPSILPATASVHIIQYLTPKWYVASDARFTIWDTIEELILYNTAGPATSNVTRLDLKNTWFFDVATHYDLTPKWSILGAVIYDQTPVNPSYTPLAFANSDAIDLYALVEYKLTKELTIGVNYAHVFYIDNNLALDYTNANNGVVTQGNANMSADLIGLRLTYSR